METSEGGGPFDAIIIGCGLSGLAAGIRLAMFDKRVLILERHNAPGGLNSFYFKDGRKFDVGLHAVTNFGDPRNRATPLGTIFRQLRLPADAFRLHPQAFSRIAFPGVDLRFSNDITLLAAEVARAFPAQADGFQRLRQELLAHDLMNFAIPAGSARAAVARHISDPLLADMLLCPLMYYGSAREDDMDYGQLATLWRSVYEEGFGRPTEGIRVIIRALLDRYRAAGGQRRMRCGVRRILVDGTRAAGVELDTGEVLTARHIISTAGWPETRVLCGSRPDHPEIRANTGRLSFTETLSVLDTPCAGLGMRETIVFFNDSDRFHYAAAGDAVDLRSGVVCMPGNYLYPEGEAPAEGILRVTAIASHAIWTGYDAAAYAAAKEAWFPRIVDAALRFMPQVNGADLQRRTIARDMFTPRTIEKFTGHFGGAVYGAPHKSGSGRTHLDNLFLAGTDQGFLGIVGSMLSGITMANRHVLTAT